ncbi:RNA-guided endonuclease InsQ/TnpB family protein, partial [Enterobacter hormaechei]
MKQGKWYISFNTEHTVPDPIHPSDIKTKIVLNNVNSVHLSSGIGGDNTSQAEEKKKLIRLNKRLARRKKHSK